VTEIGAALVKELRERTGAGMMECKRALQETGGDMDAAVTLLREKGMAAAGKRADRATSEGLVGVIVEDGVGTIVGVGCETEPVSRSGEFQALAERILRAVHERGVDAVADLEHDRVELVAKLGENIVVVGAERLEGVTVGQYVHPPANKLGVVVALDGGSPELARQLAMHVSFGRPEWATRDEVPAGTVDAERRIYLNSDEVQSKPEAAREKIVDGMLAKRFFAAIPGGVLVDQAWIHDQSRTVGAVLAEEGASVTAFAFVSVAGS
jgi:elongation factor Ts